MRGQLVVLSLVFVCSDVPAAQSSGIQRAAWLQGCWQLEASGRTVEEHWMAPRGSSMLGVSRTVRGGDLVEYELIVLKEQGE